MADESTVEAMAPLAVLETARAVALMLEAFVHGKHEAHDGVAILVSALAMWCQSRANDEMTSAKLWDRFANDPELAKIFTFVFDYMRQNSDMLASMPKPTGGVF